MDKGRIKIDGSIRDILNSHFAEITGMGIGGPPVIRLARALESGQTRFKSLPLTVKEGRIELEKVLGSSKPAVFHPPEKAAGQAIIRTENLCYTYRKKQP